MFALKNLFKILKLVLSEDAIMFEEALCTTIIYSVCVLKFKFYKLKIIKNPKNVKIIQKKN